MRVVLEARDAKQHSWALKRLCSFHPLWMGQVEPTVELAEAVCMFVNLCPILRYICFSQNLVFI